jgi:hypothetical protein
MLALFGAQGAFAAEGALKEAAIFPDFAALKDKIQVMQRYSGSNGLSRLIWTAEEPHGPFKDEKVAQAVRRPSFDEWVKYEDEFVVFYYPKSPYVAMRVITPGNGFRVSGEPVGINTENTFFRAYCLMAGEITCCAVMLDRQDDFDQGICFCGSVVYDKYLFRNGSLYRFSFVYEGDIKKIQILRSGLRAVFFE